jgi:subtilisin family serine protease
MKIVKFIVLITVLFISAGAAAKGKIDAQLDVLLSKGITVKNLKKSHPKQLANVYQGKVAGKTAIMVDVFIKADTASLAAIKAAGAQIRTVTSNGIMTASVPLDKIKTIASLTGVSQIEAARRVKKYMDVSKGVTGLNIPGIPMNAPTGQGVVVGVIDTGIDWNHPDFQVSGLTRIYAVWDQSDHNDYNPPAGFTTGTLYNTASIQNCIDNVPGSYCNQSDVDGHGSHVAGTSAGNGTAWGTGSQQYQFTGIAPQAMLVIVKFDFDGDRNSDAYIVDGIDFIFKKSAELGMPAVINMSLGSDFGPHDGSTLEEQGLDALTGAGRIVVVAAGNPGATGDNSWGNLALWGYPLHGSSTIPKGSYSKLTLNVPSYTYASGGDNELYIEISDYNNTVGPKTGNWEIRIYDRGLTEGGNYNGWHGTSSNLILTRPYYDGKPTNNNMTVGCPATANNAIAIGAYTPRAWAGSIST